MRSKSCFIILPVLFILSCHSRPAADAAQQGVSNQMASTELGRYSGHFSKGLITLVINYISGNIASGYEVHKGLRRNLNGQVEQKGGTLVFVLKEPGGNPFDGTFYITLDSVTEKITGTWVPVDSVKAHTHTGPVALARMDESKQGGERDYGDEWESDIGYLNFFSDGTCTLEYYPSEADNSQQKTIRGSYEQKADTYFIEWQNNDHTPALKMKVVKMPAVYDKDSMMTEPPFLKGNGITFTKNMAG